MGAGSILIVCAKIEKGKEIASLMMREGFINVNYALSANDALRKLNAVEPELIIVNTPLPDELGIQLILDISDKTDAGIVVLVRHEDLTQMQNELEKVGALILPKPINRVTFKQTARFASNSRKSLLGLKVQRDSLQKQIDQRKIVETAKWLLVEKLNMTEPQAHRYIQKKSMDLREPQAKIAEEIVREYD